eukprot:SAG11_NODE_13498_length_652_cov_6.969259_1_plen_86_part_10
MKIINATLCERMGEVQDQFATSSPFSFLLIASMEQLSVMFTFCVPILYVPFLLWVLHTIALTAFPPCPLPPIAGRMFVVRFYGPAC